MEHVFLDHTIKLTDDFKFTVEGLLFHGDSLIGRTFDSFVAAKREIELRVSLARKTNLRKLSIRVLNEQGEVIEITGINRTKGTVTDQDEFYPKVDWISETLRKKTELQTQLAVINTRLRQVQLKSRRTYGRLEANKYDDYIDELETELAEKTKKAEEIKS